MTNLKVGCVVKDVKHKTGLEGVVTDFWLDRKDIGHLDVTWFDGSQSEWLDEWDVEFKGESIYSYFSNCGVDLDRLAEDNTE